MFKALTPIIGIIIAVGLFFTYVKPTFEEVKGIQAETAEYATAIDKAAELQRRITELKNQKDAIEIAELERLEAMLPDRIDEVSVLIDLSELADTHHLIFGDIEVGGDDTGDTQGKTMQSKAASAPASLPASAPPAPGTPSAAMPAASNPLGGEGIPGQSGLPAKLADQYSALEISFSVAGTYDDFRAFLADLERSLVLMEVTDITFGTSEGDSVPFSVTIRLYSLSPPIHSFYVSAS